MYAGGSNDNEKKSSAPGRIASRHCTSGFEAKGLTSQYVGIGARGYPSTIQFQLIGNPRPHFLAVENECLASYGDIR